MDEWFSSGRIGYLRNDCVRSDGSTGAVLIGGTVVPRAPSLLVQRRRVPAFPRRWVGCLLQTSHSVRQVLLTASSSAEKSLGGPPGVVRHGGPSTQTPTSYRRLETASRTCLKDPRKMPGGCPSSEPATVACCGARSPCWSDGVWVECAPSNQPEVCDLRAVGYYALGLGLSHLSKSSQMLRICSHLGPTGSWL